MKSAGFPEVRGGPRSGAPATSARSFPVGECEMTDGEVARQAKSLKFRALGEKEGRPGKRVWRRRVDWLPKIVVRCDWLLTERSRVVGRSPRKISVGVRERYTFTSMETGGSLSHADVAST